MFGLWHMLYSARAVAGFRDNTGANYRLAYATSSDGIRWDIHGEPAGLERSNRGWDSESLEYASVIEFGGRWLCFYNGNGFGASGFGYATLD